MWVSLVMDITAFSIVPVYSQISVLSTGALPFAVGTLTSSLYIFLQNTGNGTGRFTVVPTGCSGSGIPVVTTGSSTQTLVAGAIAQFIFPLGALFIGFLASLAVVHAMTVGNGIWGRPPCACKTSDP